MKLCSECEFARSYGLFSKVWYCAGPHLPINPVDGKREEMMCAIQREYKLNGCCGPDGKFWRPKKKSEKLNWLMWWWR